MIESLVVTVIGADRPGLVSLMSERGRAHGASWERSRMASLAGQFAGIVHFQVPAENAAALAAALLELEGLGLRVVVATGSGAQAVAAVRTLKLELVGQDRPGIIRDISRVLAELGISIQELNTEISSAAMSGEHMFTAEAMLHVPASVPTAALSRVLETLANELMVDVTLDEAGRS